MVKLNHVKSCEQLKKSFVTFLWTLKSLSRLFPGLFPGLSFGFRESSRVQLLIFAYGTPWNSLPFPAFARALARSCASDSVPQEVDASSEGFEGSEGWHSASRSESKAACRVQKHPSKHSVFIVYLCFFMFWPTKHCFFPTCQVRVVRFYQSCSPPPPPHPPPPPRSPDPSGHSRTSTASSRSQWALPGPQPRVADRSGHCRTSTATSRSQWALPDLNRELQIPL